MDREEIIGVICDLYEELNIFKLGFSLKEVCNKLDINLIPYSFFKDKSLLLKLDEDGFNCINPKNSKIEIYYNDKIKPRKRVKFTIPHEIGHIVLNHNIKGGKETDDQKKEADIFAQEFYCPSALIIHYYIYRMQDLMSIFGITQGYAEVLIDKIGNRYQDLSENEKRLIKIFMKNRQKRR